MSAPTILNGTPELVAIESLIPHPANPRRGDLAAIRASIRTTGFYGTIVAQRSTRHILAGNHRWEAGRQEGLTEVPVVWVAVDDTTAKTILAADNRTSDLGTYDDAALATLLTELDADGRLAATGYAPTDLEQLLASLDQPPPKRTDPDDVPEEPATPTTQPGDIWHLGPHRILCGDATDPTSYTRLLGEGGGCGLLLH